MRFNGNFTSNEERKMIHDQTIRILEEVGVKVSSEKILGMLEKEGFVINWDTKIVKMTSSDVEKALAQCPREFTLGARNQEFDFKIPSLNSGFTLDGCGVNAIDFETGERRIAVTQDIVNSLKVFEEMDMGYLAWSPILASDMPVHSTEVRAYLMSFLHTSKHVQTGLDKAAETVYLRAALREILGTDDEIRKRKICSMIYCPVAPLVHEAQMMEGYLELGDLDVPLLIYPMPATGSTGPASLYSNVAISNAEVLSSVVIYQLAHPGRTLIYGSAIASLNFASGAFLEGSPEMVIQSGACADMAKYYGLPSIVAGCLTDAKQGGPQAVVEKMLTTMPLVTSGVDFVQGMGLIESSMCLKLEQLVVDNEIGHLCKRIKEGITISEEYDYIEDIKKVGPGGHFLKEKNTRKAARSSQFYKPSLMDRNAYGEWKTLGSPDMYEMAREKVKTILNSEPKNPLPHNTAKVIEEIMAAADKELAEQN